MKIANNYFTPVIPAHPQYTGFGKGYFSYGLYDISISTVVNYNRTLSFSTNTESTRTTLSNTRTTLGAGGFSPTSIYHVKGYNAGMSSIVTKVSNSTDTSTTPTISFTLERYGPCYQLPNYNRNRIYYIGGYNDPSTSYRKETTFIIQNTDTAVNETDIATAKYLGATLTFKESAYLFSGFTTGGVYTNSIDKYVMNTGTPSVLAATDETSRAHAFGLGYNSFGYVAYGHLYSYFKKFTYATETMSNGAASGFGDLHQGVAITTESAGYCWTGYYAFLIRALHKLTFATETWTDNSYSTGDTNNGWVNASSGS